MKSLSNMRISHKISLLMSGLMFGFVVIAAAYLFYVSYMSGLREDQKNAAVFQDTLAQIKLLGIQHLAESRQVVIASDHDAIEHQEGLNADLQSKFDEGRKAAAYHGMTELVSSLEQSFNEYQAVLNRVVKELYAFGFSESEGLRKELSISQSQLFDHFQENELLAAVSMLNTMNTRIREYLGSADKNFLEEIDQKQKQLVQYFSDTEMPVGTRENALALLQENIQTFGLASQRLQAMQTQKQQLKDIEQQIHEGFAKAEHNAERAALLAVRDAEKKSVEVQWLVVASMLVIAALAMFGVYSLYRSVNLPMKNMQEVIGKINEGKTTARMKVNRGDELGDLARAFNQLFNERIQRMEEHTRENEALNNSIIALIRALGLITRKNLTIKVPVSPDITGTISDAVNLLTSETAKTLQEVREISHEVNGVSEKLQDQTGVVMQFAENERRQIIATSKTLEILARTMSHIAINSEEASVSANQAIEYTQSARESVLRTVKGIHTIRETISETEKRMKRLGDRSQEISGIVTLINTIAERTHILALNASMHAASAGEAGKGFAVVADEVKRLAESSREATDDIAAMVDNIRIETADTLNVINRLITQVAAESKMAERAGHQMKETESATQNLVETVQDITRQAVEQAEVASRARDRANIIRNLTEKTDNQLAQQQSSSQYLKECADTLVDRVNAFILPEPEKEESVKPREDTSLKTIAS